MLFLSMEHLVAPSGTIPRSRLKIRFSNIDTGRENVVIVSRHSHALRPDVFRGFSRIELRCGDKSLLATLLITDDDAVVGSDELGLAAPAFRRLNEPEGTLVSISPPRCQPASMPFAPRLRDTD